MPSRKNSGTARDNPHKLQEDDEEAVSVLMNSALSRMSASKRSSSRNRRSLSSTTTASPLQKPQFEEDDEEALSSIMKKALTQGASPKTSFARKRQPPSHLKTASETTPSPQKKSRRGRKPSIKSNDSTPKKQAKSRSGRKKKRKFDSLDENELDAFSDEDDEYIEEAFIDSPASARINIYDDSLLIEESGIDNHTLEWDPDSQEGSLVGFRIRLYDSSSDTWRPGRILQYNSDINMHRVRFFTDNKTNNNSKTKSKKKAHKNSKKNSDDHFSDEWVRVSEDIVQVGSRIVWALVRGFAWWPAQVMIRKSDPIKDGYVFVEFLGSDEVATIRDIPDLIRPFNSGKVDKIILKNKKKRNEDAIRTAMEEETATYAARSAAILAYSRKAFERAKSFSGNKLGRRVKIFRSDINYPSGKTVEGTIRHYSHITKKCLVSFDSSDKRKKTYKPLWINMSSRGEHNPKFLDKEYEPIEPTNMDIAPFVFGQNAHNIELDHERNSLDSISFYHSNYCMGCVSKIEKKDVFFECQKCKKKFHPGCLDPPVTSQKAIQKILDENPSSWTCDKCVTCVGCGKLDIVHGSKVQQIVPKSHHISVDKPLALCNNCIPCYENKQFCPNCGSCHDDVRFRQTKESLELLRNKRSISINDKSAENTKEETLRRNAFGRVIPEKSWFLPDSSVWGFNEGSMLICDSCNLWVHAGCSNLTRKEYEQTNAGTHPIYAKEFLCFCCCKKRCQDIIEKLKQEDEMFLFEYPVTEDVAPTYKDVIKNPMDLTTMKEKAEKDNYYNYTWVRELFELIVLNALTFNQPNSKYWNEGKRFHEVCMKKVFSTMGKAAPPGKYYKSIEEAYTKGELALKMKITYDQQDESVEKKDLVAGAEFVHVELPPLRDFPVDPESVAQVSILNLKPLEAHFCAWMECCLACGSSGAVDTMLFCVDCGEAYHSFCVNAPIHSMSAAAAASWRCPNCKVCEITGGLPEDETKMIYCEMCDRAFSLEELEPPLECAPSGLWICGQCVCCKNCKEECGTKQVSKKSWSRDPELCFKCGGCNDGDDVYQTQEKVEEEHTNIKDEPINPEPSFCEFPIYQRDTQDLKEKKDFFENLQKEVQSLKFVQSINSVLKLHPENDKQQLKLIQNRMANTVYQEIEWEMMNSVRDMYQDIIDDGRNIYFMLQKKFGKKFFSEQIKESMKFAKTRLYLYPRAARWNRCLKRNPNYGEVNRNTEKLEKTSHISNIVLMAKNAYAFITLAIQSKACSQSDVKEYIIIPEFLDATDLNGIFSYPRVIAKDLFSEDGKMNFDHDAILNFLSESNDSTNTSSPANENKDNSSAVQQKHSVDINQSELKLSQSEISCNLENSSKSSSIGNEISQIAKDGLSDNLKEPETEGTVNKPVYEDQKSSSKSLISVADIEKVESTEGHESIARKMENCKADESISDDVKACSTVQVQSTSVEIVNKSDVDAEASSPAPANPCTNQSEKSSDKSLDVVEASEHTHTEKLALDKCDKSAGKESTNEKKLIQPTNKAEELSEPQPKKEHPQVHLRLKEKEKPTCSSVEVECMRANQTSQTEEDTTTGRNLTMDCSSNVLDTSEETKTNIVDAEIRGKETDNKENTILHSDNQCPKPDASKDDKTLEVVDNTIGKGTTPSSRNTTSELKTSSDMKKVLQGKYDEGRNLSESNGNDKDVCSIDQHDKPKENDLQHRNTSPIPQKEQKSISCPSDTITEHEVDQTTSKKVQNEDDNICGKDNYISRSTHLSFVKPKRDRIQDKVKRDGELFAASLVTKPLIGWNNHFTNSGKEWRDVRACVLCHSCGDDDAGILSQEGLQENSELSGDSSDIVCDPSKTAKCGRLLPLQGGLWVHANCALWSSEVWESVNGEVHAVEKARCRGAKLKCFGCGRSGATIGCFKSNCCLNYHFPCAFASGCVIDTEKRIHCQKHFDRSKHMALHGFVEPMKKLFTVPGNKQDVPDEINFCSRHGSLIVHCLGTIEQKYDGFHDKNNITPPGFLSTRIFWSYKSIKKRTLYIMRVDKSSMGKPIFSITAADDSHSSIQSHTAHKAYSILMSRVNEANKTSFSDGDLFSFLPRKRTTKHENSFNLNAYQFFGFALPHIRTKLENLPGVVAVTVPLTPKSPKYQFCSKLPAKDDVMDLQRKRAADLAEKALQNFNECARTEVNAVEKSTGSGRITRALVRNTGDIPPRSGYSQVVSRSTNNSGSSRTRRVLDETSGKNDSHQAMYREMKSVPIEDRLEAMRSHIHGWGLFTKIDIPKHHMIVEYMGETVRRAIADKREQMYEMSGIGSCYMFRLDREYIVDATRVGCMARFMNHCCDPNAYAKVITVDGEKGNEFKIVVFANKDILSGEEITYDYKFPVEDGSLRCTCGAKNCRGRMN